MGVIAEKGKAYITALVPKILEAVGDRLIQEFHDELSVSWDGRNKHSDNSPPFKRSGDLFDSVTKRIEDTDGVTVYCDDAISPYAKYLEKDHPFVAPVMEKANDVALEEIKKVITP